MCFSPSHKLSLTNHCHPIGGHEEAENICTVLHGEGKLHALLALTNEVLRQPVWHGADRG